MATSSVEDFLSGPLVTWFTSCLKEPDALVNYEDLVDGVALHDVFLQINPEPMHDGVVPSVRNPAMRTKNLNAIIGNIKQFYEEELGHLVLVLPDTVKLGKEPETAIGEIKLLLLLLLGCAVQCPNKEKFITKIKDMAVDVQLAIVDCIKQVTDDQNIVITQESMDNVNMGVLFNQIKRLVHDRDLYYEKWKTSTTTESADNSESAISIEIEEMNKLHQVNSIVKSERSNNHHHAVELADWKSKVRKQRQELEEKTEGLLECREELEHTKAALAKLRQENQELMHEARTAKSYRDELDAVIERAERADRLEIEVARYKEKLADIEFYKTRIEEIREDNRVLMETREMLEEQLMTTRRRSDKVPELESEILKYKQLLNDASLEREADKERYLEICDENAQLRCITKGNLAETSLSPSMSDSEEPATADNSLSEQLTNNAQTRALKLELENRRLVTLIDSLQENSFHESSTRVLELEKDKKKLTLKINSLNDNCERLTQQNADLERICRDALEENKKLQDSLNNKRALFDKQQLENQSLSTKISDLERNYESVVKEKQRIQSLQESAQRRAEDLERSLDLVNQKLEELKKTESKLSDMVLRCSELETKLLNLEREKENAQRDVNKFRLTIEDKDIALDKAANEIEIANKTIDELKQEVDDYNSQISRLRDIERSSKELDSRAAIDRETLEALQSDLVAEKLNTQHLSTVLEKFGVSINMLLSLPTDTVIETIAQVPEVINSVKKFVTIEIPPLDNNSVSNKSSNSTDINTITEQNRLQNTVETLKIESKKLRAELTASHAMSDNLLAEKAKLQVNITTLQSQNTSLTTQHTALQLANSQLVAEKEELLKERASQESIHSQLVNDQIALQILHEGLNNEYEKLLVEREVVKSTLRDVKNEARALRETCQSLEAKNKALQAERETLIGNTKSLSNLRGEHSKLKDDFRNLFTATEKLKSEYRNLQEDYKNNKMETNRLSLKQTETNGELVLKDERCAYLEFELSKLNQRCEMLLQMNSGLDNDRRSLMDHVSLLLSQYHELLTHSLDDKEHYHMEEKLFTDKVNNLCRQKEKLEEKIMEHYRKLESCSMKKKGFGASFVRRVRKAGSELLNKNRRSWAEDTKQLDGKTYESESGGNDSDASAEDIRPIRGKKEQPDTTELRSDPLSLGYPGTRRTVYYTDEIPSSKTTLDDQRVADPAKMLEGDERNRNGQIDSNTNPDLDAQNSKHPVLIYNKVSAVINESKNICTTEKDIPANIPETVGERSSEKDAKAASVWYEYGCV
ncbi:girdin isoform X1 [Neodiprion fabricii]|uniref:girdin isoform X1 n=2 Tax=Neodiprion fabricii TaxID=2872261 RepID=UPI001ED917E6|nr:girdin isoform X1 [Neodiprion fabricii]